MATILYKDGISQKFEARNVQRMLNDGWSVSPKKTLSDEDIRELAKEEGISHYWTKSIETLKTELGI